MKNSKKSMTMLLLGVVVITMMWFSIIKLNSNIKELEKINVRNQATIESLQKDNETLKDEVGELTHKINLMNMFE